MENFPKTIVRRGVKEDCVAIRAMIQELADFEKMPDGPEITAEDIARDAGFTGEHPLIHTYIAEKIDDANSALEPIGYAICFLYYSTWQGRTYFLEDLYVRPTSRTSGVGRQLFTEIAKAAKENKCKRLDFHVLGWNPASEFYKKLGAIDLTETEDWHYFRVKAEEIDKIVSGGRG